jgi:hypothetical protein
VAYLIEENLILRGRFRLTDDTVFVIDLASRHVHIVDSTPHPDERFMQQVVRTLTTAEDRLLGQHHVPIVTAISAGRSLSTSSLTIANGTSRGWATRSSMAPRTD